MSLPVWPAAIPYQSLRSGWSGTPFRRPLSTEMEGGNTRLRSEPGSDVGTYAWSGILDAAKMSVFEAFVEDAINNGSARFAMMVSRNGITYVMRPVQIVSDIKYTSVGGPNTLVQFTLQVLPASLLGGVA